MSISIACIDYRDGKVFVAKRQNVGDMGGRWEFPGGKVEDDEDFATAIKREMFEEFGVDVSVGNKITESKFFHGDKECGLNVFAVTFAHDGMKSAFKLTEHTEYKWVSFDEIPNLNFVDSDMDVYPVIRKYFEK